MKAADIMTMNVICTTPGADIRDVAETMLMHRVSGLPVLDAGHALVGIVTEGDLLRRVETGTAKRRSGLGAFLAGPGKLAADFIGSHSRRVEDVMTRKVVTVSEDATLTQIVDVMERNKVNRVPVTVEGRVIGIVARPDLLRSLGKRPTAAAQRTDEEICRDISAEFEKEAWVNRISKVTVRDGVAEVWGTVLYETERRAICVMIENVPGVKAVMDHMVWVEPYTGSVVESEGTAR